MKNRLRQCSAKEGRSVSTAHDLGDPAGLQATPPREAREAGPAEHAMRTVRFCFLTGEGASQKGGHSDVSLASSCVSEGTQEPGQEELRL